MDCQVVLLREGHILEVLDKELFLAWACYLESLSSECR